jgi:NADH-quinone oxidoreductase subunit C
MEIRKEALVQTCRGLKEKGFDYLKKITAVDYLNYIEVVYVLYNTKSKEQEILYAQLDLRDPSIESNMSVYSAADWYEREMAEMFGIEVMGREKTKRLLLEEWNGSGYPLLKSFEWGKEYKKLE